MAKTVYDAPAIHCEGCANSIQRSLGKLSGVDNVQVNVTAKRVEVEYDPEQTSEEAVRERLALAGFPAEPVEE